MKPVIRSVSCYSSTPFKQLWILRGTRLPLFGRPPTLRCPQTSNSYFVCSDPPTIDKIFSRIRNFDNEVRSLPLIHAHHTQETAGNYGESALPCRDCRSKDHPRRGSDNRLRHWQPALAQACSASLFWAYDPVQGGVHVGRDEDRPHNTVSMSSIDHLYWSLI